jgi:hypothetical protein
MAATTPPIDVPAPPAGPRRYGLFNAARLTDLPTHGRTGGVQFEPDTCGIARPYTAECPPSAQDVKTLSDLSPVVTVAPFVVYASVLCAPVGRTPEEQQRRAIQRLYAGEQTVAEAALWNGGGVGAAPALTVMTSTTVVSAATTFGARLAALEQAFYDAYGYQGTIHVNTAAEGAAAFGNLIVRPDTPDIPGHLVTPIGSIWSFGSGYGITGPGNVAPAAGSVWAFMTGAVTVWRSPDSDLGLPDPRQTFNRTTNQMVAVAEREYAIAPDCPDVFAIELPLEAP